MNMTKNLKTVIEPVRLIRMLSQTMALGQSTIADDSLIQFTKEGAIVRCALASDSQVLANYNPSFFVTYTPPEEDFYFTVTKSLVKERIGKGFKGDKVTFRIDDAEQKVFVEGTGEDDVVEEKLTDPDLERVANVKGKQISTYLSKVGLLPYGNPETKMKIPFSLQALVAQDKFTDLDAEQAELEFDGKKLTMYISDQMGKRTRLVPIKKYAENGEIVEKVFGQPVSVTVNFKLLKQHIIQFEGDVWLNINDGMIIVSQANKDYNVSYLQALIV